MTRLTAKNGASDKCKKLYQETGYLKPTAPFDFDKSLEFLGIFSPMQDEQAIAVRLLTKALRIAGQTVVFQIQSIGTIEEPKLEYRLFSAQPLAAATKSAIVDRMTFFLSLEENLQPFYALGYNDPDFAPILQKLYGYHQVKFLTPFENACWAVLSQRKPIAIAQKTKRALIEKFGSSLEVNGTVYCAFPEPTQLATADTDELISVIRNQRKAEYLSAVARAFMPMDEEFLRKASYKDVEAWLREIPGIGSWSAEFILLRGLGRMERVPFTEKRLLEAASRVYGQGEAMTRQSIQSIAQKYGSWQGYWAHYLRAAS